MELQDLLLFIEQYGYFALFFSLWLGIIGMPLPDEMIVMSGGFLSSLGKLVIWKSFLLTYLFRRCFRAFSRIYTWKTVWSSCTR